MTEQDQPTPEKRSSRRSIGRRELTAGALAVVLTVITAGAAVWVNVGAANPQVPSQAGAADRADLVVDTAQQAPTVQQPPQVSTNSPAPTPSTDDSVSAHRDDRDDDEHREDDEREGHEYEKGHDDDD